MTSREPIITDPEHRRRVEGQSFVVLRAEGDLGRSVVELQREARRALAGLSVSYPNVPHATLVSLPSGTDSDVLRDVVTRWAKGSRPLPLEPVAVGVFPPPHQVLRVKLRNTPELQGAQSALIQRVTDRGLTELTAAEGLLPEWVFHITIAYCDHLSDQDWVERVLPLTRTLAAPTGAHVCEEAELITFEQERSVSWAGARSAGCHDRWPGRISAYARRGTGRLRAHRGGVARLERGEPVQRLLRASGAEEGLGESQ